MATGVRAQRQQETRQKLLGAASRVFARRGFSAASVPEIAEEAGVSTGAIYSNFSGKEELFLSMMMSIAQAGAEDRAASIATETDRTSLLERFVGRWTQTVDEDPQVAFLMAEFWLYALRRPPMQEVVAAFLTGVRDNIAENLAEVGPDLDQARRVQLASCVQAMAYGYAMQRLADPDATPPDDLVQGIGWLLDGATASS